MNYHKRFSITIIIKNIVAIYWISGILSPPPSSLHLQIIKSFKLVMCQRRVYPANICCVGYFNIEVLKRSFSTCGISDLSISHKYMLPRLPQHSRSGGGRRQGWEGIKFNFRFTRDINLHFKSIWYNERGVMVSIKE